MNKIVGMAHMPSIYMRVGMNRDIWSTSTFLPCPRFHAAIDCKSLVSTKGHLTYVCRAVRLYTKLYQRRRLNFCSAYPSCTPSSFPFRLLCMFFITVILLIGARRNKNWPFRPSPL